MGDPLSTEEAEILTIIAHISSLLSLIGSSFIISSFLIFRNLRKAHGVLIFWLSVCDFFSSLAYFAIPVAVDFSFCYAQGLIIQFFQIASFIWTSSIASALYLVLVRNKSFNIGIDHTYKYFHAFTWSFAAIDVGIAAAFNSFGSANFDEPGTKPSWCWIKYDRNAEKFLLYFLPFLVICLFNIVVYITVLKKINNVVKSRELKGRAFHRMRLYLLVFMLCIGIGAINRFQNFISPKNPIFWLNILDATVSPLQGFLNCLVYGMNKQIRNAWFDLMCCCFKSREVEKEPLLSARKTDFEDKLVN